MSLPKTEPGLRPLETVADGMEVTRDAFLDGRLTVYQPKSGPRAAIDAVFLAAAVPVVAGAGQRVLEAGTGSGVASLALCARVEDVQITGVETQAALARLVRKNAALNAMQDRLRVIEADVTSPWIQLEEAGIARESFDHAAANPPYHTNGSVRQRTDRCTATAYSFGADALEKWVRFLTTAVAPRGTVTLIHRPQALPMLLELLEPRFGALRVFPLFPASASPASRVLVQGTKGSKAPFELLPGMVLHEGDGRYTSQADAVLRGARALTLKRF